MTVERDIQEDLKPSTGDYAHAGVRAGLSTAPFLGGPLAEFFSMVIAPPLEKRRDAWMTELFTRLTMLEEQVEGFKIENLAKNEEFISTLLYATQVAMRTHQREKLEALQNIVTNSAIGITANENFQVIFLNIIDRYTPLHLLILRFVENPGLFRTEYRGIKTNDLSLSNELRDAFRATFPELNLIDEHYAQIVRDLSADGLIISYKLPDRELMGKPKITALGDQFLTIIRSSEMDVSHNE